VGVARTKTSQEVDPANFVGVGRKDVEEENVEDEEVDASNGEIGEPPMVEIMVSFTMTVVSPPTSMMALQTKLNLSVDIIVANSEGVIVEMVWSMVVFVTRPSTSVESLVVTYVAL
jgi:hypothetical protein